MADADLRSLERAALTGDLEAETRLLVARLRAAPECERCGGSGELWRSEDLHPALLPIRSLGACPSCAGTGSPMRARVELAAYCKSASARAALGNPSRSFPIPFTIKDPPAGMGRLAYRWHVLDTRWDLGRWVRGLSRWSDLHEQAPGWVLVRAQAAAARAVVAAYHEKGRPLGLEPLRALESAEDWLDNPTDAARSVAVVDWTHAWGPDWGQRHANLWLPILPDWANGKWSDALQPHHAIERAAQEAGEASIRSAISSSLVSWALGRS